MPSRGLGAYSVKIHQIVFGALFVLLVLVGVRRMMAGGTGNIKVLAAASVLIGLVLALDRYYWALCLFFFVSGLNVPGLPFEGREIACLALISVYFIRQAMQKENPIRLNMKTLVAVPVFIWICAIWITNPTGLAILGASSIGARFYFKIVLGFLSLLVLSSFRFSEKDCKVLFYVVVAAALISFIKTLITVRLGAYAEGFSFEDQAGRYYFLGALTLYTLMLARYTFKEMLSSPWKFCLTVLFAILVVLSGKRRAFATLFILPVLRVCFTGREKAVLVFGAVCGAALLFVAVGGDGALWELPNSAKRALSIVVPEYETSSAMGMQDVFREGVRREGREVIRRSPWVGRKGFSMDRGETAWIAFGKSSGMFEGHAYAGNWHSTWYAFAADFGLPAMILWGGFLLYALFWTYSGYRRNAFTDYSLAAYIYYSYALFIGAVFSYTSGHSAETSLSTWFVYGMLIAIRNGVEDANRERIEVAA